MLLLLLFAIIAGAGTAITPCVLPVLPALLSASAVGGRRRPLGIVLGLGLTFTIAIVALARLVNGIGLAGGATRVLAIVVLIVFGVVMLVPALAQRVQAPLSRLARFGPKTRGDGFWTGLGVGGALGFVCAPCGGPILAAVIGCERLDGTDGADRGDRARLLRRPVRGAAAVRAGRTQAAGTDQALRARARRRAGACRGSDRHRRGDGVQPRPALRRRLRKHTTSLPAILTDPTEALENSNAVENRLAALRPTSTFLKNQEAAEKKAKANPTLAASLPDDGTAPNFTDTQDWFHTPGDKPLSITQLRGKVVIVDFWTYTCINCIRTLPFVEGSTRTTTGTGWR